MKNLRPYPENCFLVHQNAVTRKQDSALRTRVALISFDIEQEYNLYQQHFNTNTLEAINTNPALEPHRNDLLSLYAYRSKVIRDVRRIIENQQLNTVKYTCQNCGLAPTESMDHFLPKESFPAFIVNPLNLFPSCTSCNRYKSKGWLIADRRAYLNLFLDQLPVDEYLFVDISEDSNGEIDFSFELRNTNNINPTLFTLLENHFTRLNLRERMRRASITYISEFQNSISANLQHLTIAQITDIQMTKSREDRASYGHNYWKAALELALIQSPFFLKTIVVK